MSNLEKIVRSKGLGVISSMVNLENATSMEEFDEISEEFCQRVRIWRGSILCKLAMKEYENREVELL